MIKYLLLLLPFMAGCHNNLPEQKNNTSVSGTTPAASTVSVFTKPTFAFNYAQQKKRCQQLFAERQMKRTPETEKKLISFIADSLVPCWYGTPWDYNGISEVPGEGKIACGYLVTTTLRDAGMKINRVKMAQCVSQNLLYDLCRDFKKFSNKPLAYFVKEVEKSGYGLYIVGLDNHTGYIYHDGRDVWFIHSGVLPPRCALKEKAIESETLRRSVYRVVGRIKL